MLTSPQSSLHLSLRNASNTQEIEFQSVDASMSWHKARETGNRFGFQNKNLLNLILYLRISAYARMHVKTVDYSSVRFLHE